MNQPFTIKKYPVLIHIERWNFQNIFLGAIFVLMALILASLAMSVSLSQAFLLTGGALLLVISIRNPEIGILAIIAIIASIIFEDSLPLISIPGGSFHITDVILLTLLAIIPIRALTARNFQVRRTPLDLPLMLFILAALISAGISIINYGLDFNFIIRGLRPIIYYILYFPITNLVREKRQIRFLFGGLFGIATFVSLVMIVQAVVGESIRLMPGRIEAAAISNQVFWAASRILPPGRELIFVMFISAVCTSVFINKPFFKSGYFFLPPIIGGGIILTYHRQYWICIIISLSIFMLLISEKRKRKVFVWLLMIVIFVGLVILPLRSVSKTMRVYVDSIAARFHSLFTVDKTFRTRSIEWRRIENKYAWQSIRQHPLLGIGLRNNYRPNLPGMSADPYWTKQFQSSYIHNGFLFVLIDMGLLGFLPFMWFYFYFVARGLKSWRKIIDPLEKSIVIGCTVSAIALCISTVFSPKFMEWYSIVVMATIIGLTESVILRNEKESKQTGLQKS